MLKGRDIFVASRAQPYRINERDIEIVRSLNRYFYLTAAQVCRLFYKRGSLTFVKEKLRALVAAGYADACSIPRTQSRGNLPYVYRLGAKGLTLLRDLDEPTPYRLRRYATINSEYHLPHTLAVNDVLISADMLSQVQPAVSVAALLHERVLKQQPVAVTLPSGVRKGVIPDGVIDFDIADTAGAARQFVILELDMGSKQEAWKRKAERLILYGSGPFQARYKTHSFSLAVVTPKGERHMRDLKRWFEAVLVAKGLRESAWRDAVFFTSRDATDSPDLFWLAPGWSTPFSDEPAVLLDVSLA